jgi:hypothetical protein
MLWPSIELPFHSEWGMLVQEEHKEKSQRISRKLKGKEEIKYQLR